MTDDTQFAPRPRNAVEDALEEAMRLLVISDGWDKPKASEFLIRATAPLVDLLEQRRVELRDRRNDDMEIRGILAPADGDRIVPHELGKTLAPAIQWLVDDWRIERASNDVDGKERSPLAGVLNEIRAERGRQDEKWGEQNHPDGTGDFQMGLDADVARMVCDDAAADGNLTWAHVLREEFAEALADPRPAELRAELVQVAAVAVAWIEAIDRRRLAELFPGV